eukprot:1170104-Amphidinium_carterae.1
MEAITINRILASVASAVNSANDKVRAGVHHGRATLEKCVSRCQMKTILSNKKGYKHYFFRDCPRDIP